MAVTFWKSYIFQRNCLGTRHLKKSYFFIASTSAQHQPFQKSYILKKAHYSEKQYCALPTVSGELPF